MRFGLWRRQDPDQEVLWTGAVTTDAEGRFGFDLRELRPTASESVSVARLDELRADDAKRFGVTMKKEVPMTTIERAYTSPIWYEPK